MFLLILLLLYGVNGIERTLVFKRNTNTGCLIVVTLGFAHLQWSSWSSCPTLVFVGRQRHWHLVKSPIERMTCCLRHQRRSCAAPRSCRQWWRRAAAAWARRCRHLVAGARSTWRCRFHRPNADCRRKAETRNRRRHRPKNNNREVDEARLLHWEWPAESLREPAWRAAGASKRRPCCARPSPACWCFLRCVATRVEGLCSRRANSPPASWVLRTLPSYYFNKLQVRKSKLFHTFFQTRRTRKNFTNLQSRNNFGQFQALTSNFVNIILLVLKNIQNPLFTTNSQKNIRFSKTLINQVYILKGLGESKAGVWLISGAANNNIKGWKTQLRRRRCSSEQWHGDVTAVVAQ